MLSRWDNLVGTNVKALLGSVVVTVPELAIDHVERPATELAALRDDRPMEARIRRVFDTRRYGVGFILDHDHRVLGQPLHVWRENLRLAFNQLRTSCE